MVDFDYKKGLEMSKATFGYELYGYWEFFNRDDSAKTILDHVRNLYNRWIVLMMPRNTL